MTCTGKKVIKIKLISFIFRVKSRYWTISTQNMIKNVIQNVHLTNKCDFSNSQMKFLISMN